MSFDPSLLGRFVRIITDAHPKTKLGFVVEENPQKNYRAIYTGSDPTKELRGKLVAPSNHEYPYIIGIYDHRHKIICKVKAKREDFILLNTNYHILQTSYEGKFKGTQIYSYFYYHILPPQKAIIGFRSYELDSDPYYVKMYILDNELIEIIKITRAGTWYYFDFNPLIHPNIIVINQHFDVSGYFPGSNMSYEYEISFTPL